MTTITRLRHPSLVQSLPSLRPRRNMKYRLVYDTNTQRYNGGIPFDIEEETFATRTHTPQHIVDFARSLDDVSKSIGRVYCYDKGSEFPRGCTTGFFFVDNEHILTTSDLLQDDGGVIVDPTTREFRFSMRASTGSYLLVARTLMQVSYVYHTNSLLLLHVNAPPSPLCCLVPNKHYLMATKLDANNTNPDYLRQTVIGAIGYCGKVTLETALLDYNTLPENIRGNIRPPTAEDLADFPFEHKALFPGRLLHPSPDSPYYLYGSLSAHHGCCGSPVFSITDPRKFIGIIYGGDRLDNDNAILGVLSPEFDDVFRKL